MGSASCGETSQHRAVREAVAAYVRRYGRKAGLHRAAQAIGFGEGVARNAYEGRHIAADAERAAAADEARLALITDEIARLRREAAELEHRGMHVDTARARMDARGGVLRGAGASLLRARSAVTP